MSVAKGLSGLSFKSVQELLNTSGSQHGDLADQADSETGSFEARLVAIEVGRASADPAQEEEYLDRFVHGKLDKCAKCGDEIPEIRRKAMPRATLCCTCQEAVSQKN